MLNFSDSSTTGYALAVIFIIAGIFIVVGLFVYSRRKKPNSLAQQLEIIVSKFIFNVDLFLYPRLSCLSVVLPVKKYNFLKL